MTKAELALIMSSVKSYVDSRLLMVSERQGPAGERGERGEKGDTPEVDVNLAVSEYMSGNFDALADKVRSGIPLPKNGIDGKDGLPGRNGIDGKDGLPGQDGMAGRDGERGADGLSIMGPKGDQGERGISGESIVGPLGPRGERGLPGESIQGPKGDTGERGMDGLPGKDAVLPDIESMVQRAFDVGFARWAVDQERRAQDVLQHAIDKMPKPKDGKDGLELEDLTVDHDGHGNVTLTFKRGELSRSFTLRFPCFEYRGVWLQGTNYQCGHSVTYGGNIWMASKDEARGKPGDRDTDWILAVKKGRDAREPAKLDPPKEGPVKL